MGRMSVLIPSRNEKYLTRTIEDIFSKARGELEIVAILDGGDWPEGWKETVAKYPNLHTIRHGESQGMRPAINSGAASAISRGAKYLCKFDAHVMVDEGFDVKLTAEMERNWIVVPRRKRLDPETWTLTDTNKPDIDYHYLSFPDDPQDFGGPGLNGKVWEARARERADIKLDTEMSSQGSGWVIYASYFTELELMDAESYGSFWNEAQEFGLKCWLSGGQLMINKNTWYAHWHKGKAGRGYRLAESLLKQGRNYTMKWLYNEAWPGQTLPFKSLIERFWPVPSWPENWEELVYGADRKSGLVAIGGSVSAGDAAGSQRAVPSVSLKIHEAHYGIGGADDVDVRDHLQSLVKDDALDIVVNNATITPGQNPFRGQKKKLWVAYSYDGGEQQDVVREEKEWLIVGQAQAREHYYEEGSGRPAKSIATITDEAKEFFEKNPDAKSHTIQLAITKEPKPPLTAAALNDHLIRKFKITDRRLRGPMPIEVREFHRDDLAVLFAELGFRKGAEIGVAEGKYSEVLLKANPECELLLVDPWHAYSDNPQNKTKEKNEFAYNETVRRTAGYNVKLDMRYSMDAVRDVADGSLDYCYIDGQHQFNYVIMDIIEWSKKVRSGGLIVLDDYYFLDPKRWGAGVVEAVQAYTSAHKINPWFSCSGHKSIEAFWVNP